MSHEDGTYLIKLVNFGFPFRVFEESGGGGRGRRREKVGRWSIKEVKKGRRWRRGGSGEGKEVEKGRGKTEDSLEEMRDGREKKREEE